MDRAAALATELATPLASTALTRQRTLPVAGPLQPLLPDGALARGRTISCRGPAATSLAVALAAAATESGAWLAVVDVPWLGVEAVAELGVPLERLVRVDPGSSGSTGTAWAELVAAVLDGFEVVVTRIPRRLNGGVLRRVLARVQAREGVLIAVGEPGALTPDITLDAVAPVWEGLDGGAGHLRGRRVTVTAAGRRIPGARRAELWLPGPGGGVAAIGEPRLRSVG